ncbi:MAG: TrbC/VirB2 family protein [Cetobacterium sp.]|uniref:TrbC/VirB2 family protein n=1 Tax=Bacteria TaxID=2 RepID=UPI002FCC5DFB
MDVIQQLATLGNEVVSWLQTLGIPAAALAFAFGGMQHIFGGSEGIRKAKPWYMGAIVGFIVILGASSFANFLQTKITF